MADKDLFSRLKRLFSTNTIVRNIGGRKLKIVDTGQLQSNVQTNLVDRYSKLYSNMQQYGYNDQLYQQQLRLGLFRDYESMDSDSIIASALDIYSDESTMKNEYGKVLDITTDNDQIHDILHNLFYDILNIEFNLWPWVRNMNKYGDFFLQLEITDKYGITNVTPMSAYDVARMEGHDPDNPQNVQFLLTPQGDSSRHSAKQKDPKTFENYEVAHFRLLSDSNYVPYGRSMLEGGRKVWKQLTLMEDAMLIHRIMRAPEKRVFKLDIGNIPPAEVDNFMQQTINKMKKAPVIDEKTGDYNLRYNIQNLTEDFFLPVRGGDSGTNIESLSGLDYDAVDDIEYLRNRLMASLRVPKAFLGYEEGLGSKATLAAEDVRFARTIERIQRIIVSELTKIAIVHLYSQGIQDSELTNFELSLVNPSFIYEQEKVNLWSEKIRLAQDIQGLNMLSKDWVYDNIFKLSRGESDKQRETMIEDLKDRFRFRSIEDEGSDPAKEDEAEDIEESLENIKNELKDKGGRPREGSTYKKDKHPYGRDPLGDEERKNALKKETKFSTEKIKNIVNGVSSKRKFLKETDMLDESNIIEE